MNRKNMSELLMMALTNRSMKFTTDKCCSAKAICHKGISLASEKLDIVMATRDADMVNSQTELFNTLWNSCIFFILSTSSDAHVFD